MRAEFIHARECERRTGLNRYRWPKLAERYRVRVCTAPGRRKLYHADDVAAALKLIVRPLRGRARTKARAAAAAAAAATPSAAHTPAGG